MRPFGYSWEGGRRRCLASKKTAARKTDAHQCTSSCALVNRRSRWAPATVTESLKARHFSEGKKKCEDAENFTGRGRRRGPPSVYRLTRSFEANRNRLAAESYSEKTLRPCTPQAAAHRKRGLHAGA